jgi:hypothetical protein
MYRMSPCRHPGQQTYMSLRRHRGLQIILLSCLHWATGWYHPWGQFGFLLWRELWSQRNSRCYGIALKQHSFLGNDREVHSGTMSVTRKQILNKQEQTSAARERLGKPIHAETVNIRERTVLSCGPCRGVIRKTVGATESVLYGSLKQE